MQAPQIYTLYGGHGRWLTYLELLKILFEYNCFRRFKFKFFSKELIL